MNEEIPVFTLIQRGTNEFPRVVVAKADERSNAVYWTGTQWTSDENLAALYADVNAAAWVLHDLTMECVKDRPCHYYIAPVYVEIHGDKPNLSTAV